MIDKNILEPSVNRYGRNLQAWKWTIDTALSGKTVMYSTPKGNVFVLCEADYYKMRPNPKSVFTHSSSGEESHRVYNKWYKELWWSVQEWFIRHFNND